MSLYVTSAEFLASPYGSDFQPGNSIFSTSGQITDFLTSVSSLVDLYCGRKFGSTTYEDLISGEDQKNILLDFFPLISVMNVTYHTIGSSGVVSSGSYISFKDGRVKFNTRLTNGYEYKVTYQAGYDVIPDAIKQATLMLAHTYAISIDSGNVGIADGGNIVSFKFGKFQEEYVDPRQRSVSYDEGIPVTVQAILRRFRHQKV